MKKPVVVSTSFIADAKTRAAIAAAALAAVYYQLPVPFFLLVLFLSYLMWSYYWTMMSSKSTVASSQISHNRIFAGESFLWTLRCSNGWFLPLVRCGISVFMPSQLTFSSSVPVSASVQAGNTGPDVSFDKIFPSWKSCTVSYAWLAEKKDISVQLQVKARQRGIYFIPPAHFFAGDPSGFFRGMNQLVKEEYLYVFPRLKSTEELLKSKVFADNTRDASYGLEDRYQVQGVRDYQISDPLKSINWYATARTGSLKTNLYQSKDSEYCLVVFDLSVSHQPSYDSDTVYGEDSSLEDAISLAAGIALYHLEQGAKTAFFTNAPLVDWVVQDNSLAESKKAYMKRIRTISSLDYAEGEEQAQKILELCAAIDGSNRANLEEQRRLWASVQKKIQPGTLVYLLAYHTPPKSWEEKVTTGEIILDPSTFYNPERLGSLPSNRVRMLNLSRRVEAN